ncbi:acyl-coenzyme A thioesterase 13-like [Watersipora subatra]|uniref:acyl-coenzyme A thioesterase 13-like n=1 Tax=Watersipora subatra TaxID=2589382 RepID=UPI00355AE1B1
MLVKCIARGYNDPVYCVAFTLQNTNCAMSKVKNAQQLWQMIQKTSSFDGLMKKVELVSAGNGSCVCKMKVGEEHTNLGGTLHGGMTATLVDTVSTVALLTSEPYKPGVSVELSVSYLRAVPLGENITIDAKTVKTGKTLSFLAVDLLDSKDRIIAQGKHTKFVGDN